jgi:hypothetical protein
MPRPRKPRGGSDTVSGRGLVQLLLTVTPEEKRQIRAAAGAAGLPVSHWLRRVAVAAARTNTGRQDAPAEPAPH